MLAKSLAFVLCVCVMLGDASVAGQQVTAGDVVRASDVQNARDRIDTLRTDRGLGAYMWTDPSLVAETTVISAAHQLEARTALRDAYLDDSLPAPTYTNPIDVGDSIRAVDLNELLADIAALEGPVIGVDPIAYSTGGNTLLRAGGAPTSVGAFVANASGIVDKASVTEPSMLGLTFTLNSPASGVVTVLSNGRFTYNPPSGFSGSDMFTYKVSNGTGDTIGTVNITVAGRVWYVDNDFGGSPKNGSSGNPFDTLRNAESSTFGSGSSAAGDVIFLFAGDGTTTNQNAGIFLETNQLLLGHGGTNFTVGSLTIQTPNPPGSPPKINNATGDGVTIRDRTGSTIRSLDISGTDNGIDISTTAANGATLTVTVTDTDVTASNDGIRIDGSLGTGSLGVTLTSIDIDGAGGDGVKSTKANLTVDDVSVGP